MWFQFETPASAGDRLINLRIKFHRRQDPIKGVNQPIINFVDANFQLTGWLPREEANFSVKFLSHPLRDGSRTKRATV